MAQISGIIYIITLDTKLLHYYGLIIKGVMYHHTTYYVRKAFKLIEKRFFETSKFINFDMPLEKLVDALELMSKQKMIKYNIET